MAIPGPEPCLPDRDHCVRRMVDAPVASRGTRDDLANNADNGSVSDASRRTSRDAGSSRSPHAEEAIERIRSMRFGKDGYYTVMTDEPKMLMHPFKPELIGRTLGDFRDANGTLLYREAANAAKPHGAFYALCLATPRWRPTTTQAYPCLEVQALRLDLSQCRLCRRDQCRIPPVVDSLRHHSRRNRTDAVGHRHCHKSRAAAIACWRAGVFGRNCAARRKRRPERAGQYPRQQRAQPAACDGRDAPAARAYRERDQTLCLVHHIRYPEIAIGNGDLPQRTEEQAALLQETASSMEQMTSVVTNNADNALHANELASTASDIADRGGELVDRAIGTMQETTDFSARIAEIVSVMEGIAFQTNIPALNAAVEAARAGEHSRGVAVVASEVRGLVLRAAAAAKDAKLLIHKSVTRVESGSGLVSETGIVIPGDCRRGQARGCDCPRDRGELERTERRHPAGWPRDFANGFGDPTERGARRAGGCGRPIAERASLRTGTGHRGISSGSRRPGGRQPDSPPGIDGESRCSVRLGSFWVGSSCWRASSS
jgi:methyl-accepting chemotaxis protein